MQIETLFSMGQARVMMSVAGAMFAALALRLAWRLLRAVGVLGWRQGRAELWNYGIV